MTLYTDMLYTWSKFLLQDKNRQNYVKPREIMPTYIDQWKVVFNYVKKIIDGLNAKFPNKYLIMQQNYLIYAIIPLML